VLTLGKRAELLSYTQSMRLKAIAGAFLLLGALAAWLSDFVTLDGQWTIYTVDCQAGEWRSNTCTGRLSAGTRYQFWAVRANREVLFWTPGARSESSGKFTNCTIASGRTWSCPPGNDSAQTITISLQRGKARHDASGTMRQFHAVPKLRWLLLRAGINTGSKAE
jgi:hypothetical protein